MSKPLAAALTLTLAAFAAPSVQAAAFTVQFSADGFQNSGVQHPGNSGPISGSMSWEAASPADAIGVITAFDMVIAGHQYTLGEIGVANQGSTQTAFGGLANGANAVIGNGAFDDFLIVFDRLAPRIDTFAYSIRGLTGAIWWTPAQSSIRYVTQAVPEPASVLLVLAALGAVAALGRRRGGAEPQPVGSDTVRS
jgi:PEP-CTERM motif